MAEMTVPEQQCQMNQHERNWVELPSDVTANILYRIGVIEILENAQKVCTTWRKICKDPSMWRVIHMKNLSGPLARLEGLSKHVVHLSQSEPVNLDSVHWPNDYDKLLQMCKHAVDLSQGQLVDIKIVDFADDVLLQYIADRSSQLKRLEILGCDRGWNRAVHWNWSQALEKFSMLEELNLHKIEISKQAIEIAGRCCPMLKTLKLNQETCKYWHGGTSEKSLMIRNRTAKAIGENLLELRHLELIGNNMTNSGLEVILNGCRYLESIDLRQCLYIDLKADIGKKCLGKIKSIKLPEDPLEKCLYMYGNDCVTCDEDSYADCLAGMDFEDWTIDEPGGYIIF